MTEVITLSRASSQLPYDPKVETFLLSHPRAYLQEASGLRCGAVRYREWRLIDPDQDYATIGVGETKQDAVNAALRSWREEPIESDESWEASEALLKVT